MRLTDLDPKWLVADGRRMGLVLRCPHCRKCFLSCFAVPMPRICGDDYRECQYALFATVLPASDADEVVPCKRNYAWTFSPPIEQAIFENLTIQPSLDCSASGHWHGFVTNGEIS